MGLRICTDCGEQVEDDNLKNCPRCVAALPFPENFGLKDLFRDLGMTEEEIDLFGLDKEKPSSE